MPLQLPEVHFTTVGRHKSSSHMERFPPCISSPVGEKNERSDDDKTKLRIDEAGSESMDGWMGGGWVLKRRESAHVVKIFSGNSSESRDFFMGRVKRACLRGRWRPDVEAVSSLVAAL